MSNGKPSEFPLLAKWVSRKFASVAAFYVFVSNVPASPNLKVVTATIVTGLYFAANAVLSFKHGPDAAE